MPLLPTAPGHSRAGWAPALGSPAIGKQGLPVFNKRKGKQKRRLVCLRGCPGSGGQLVCPRRSGSPCGHRGLAGGGFAPLAVPPTRAAPGAPGRRLDVPRRGLARSGAGSCRRWSEPGGPERGRRRATAARRRRRRRAGSGQHFMGRAAGKKEALVSQERRIPAYSAHLSGQEPGRRRHRRSRIRPPERAAAPPAPALSRDPLRRGPREEPPPLAPEQPRARSLGSRLQCPDRVGTGALVPCSSQLLDCEPPRSCATAARRAPGHCGCVPPRPSRGKDGVR